MGSRIEEVVQEERRKSEQEAQRYREALPGWKRKQGSAKCPRVVAGKRCRIGYPANSVNCICQVYFHRILDHSRMWIDENGHKVMTSEPYNIDLDVLDEFRAECRKLGLSVSLRAYSPYNPGATMMIIIRKGK